MGRQVVLLFDSGNGNRQSTKTWGVVRQLARNASTTSRRIKLVINLKILMVEGVISHRKAARTIYL